MFWIQIRSGVMLVLIWIQTDRKGCRKTAQFPAIKERVKWSDFVGEDANRDMIMNLIIYFLIVPTRPE